MARSSRKTLRIHPQLAHQVRLLVGGQAYMADLVRDIDAAHTSVHLETYWFDFEGAPLMVAQALERAAQRGVAVRLLTDGIGTAHAPAEWQVRLTRAGVHWRVFSPPGRLGWLFPTRWRRLHRKLCVIDGRVGYCGGINLIDDLWDPDKRQPLPHPRFDFAVRCEGPLVQDMETTLQSLWFRQQMARDVRRGAWRAVWGDVKGMWRHSTTRHLWHGASPSSPSPVPDEVNASNWVQACLVLRDNLWFRADIERMYLKAIGEARQEIVLAHAYFLPSRRIQRALRLAVARGVKVKVLVQGYHEGFMHHHAMRPLFQWFLNAGIEMFEYTPTALHAKVAVVDGRWATVGSSNLDPLSLLLAREANVVIHDPAWVSTLRQHLVHALEHQAHAIDHRALALRGWRQRLLDRLAYGLAKLMLVLTGYRYW